MTAEELDGARKILRTYELNIERYDLDYGYDEELNEEPDVPEDMDDYSETLIAHARVEMETPASERKWEEIAKNLGLAGALRKITGKVDEAEKLLAFSLKICREQELSKALHLQQRIRYADVLRRQGKLQKSLEDFQDLLKETAGDGKYEDVVIQHTGKVHFSMGQYPQALKLFEQALKMRRKKGDDELIASTETAITACLEKMDR